MNEQPTVSLARAIGRPVLDAQEEGRRVERLPGVHLELKIGGTLAMQFAQDLRFEGKVVGFEAFSYVIVHSRIPQDALARISGNPGLVGQHTVSGVVFGFRSQVVNRITNPAPLLFLSFPDSVDRVVLRRDERVSVNMPCFIHGKYGEHEAVIVDLTPSGCRISAKIDMKSPLREAQVGDQLILNGNLGRDQELTTPIEVRRLFNEKGLLYIGAQFVDLTRETSQMVAGYVDGLRKFLSA